MTNFNPPRKTKLVEIHEELQLSPKDNFLRYFLRLKCNDRSLIYGYTVVWSGIRSFTLVYTTPDQYNTCIVEGERITEVCYKPT